MTALAVSDSAAEAEMAALVADLRAASGHDFSGYAPTSRARRIAALIASERVAGIAGLRRRLAEDPSAAARAVAALSVPATTMFRDPAVFRALRERVLPQLASFPIIRCWLAGCATGEEAWSLAIILHELGLAERSRLYATDLNPAAVAAAQAGAVPLAAMRDATRSYHAAAGTADFSSYYRVVGGTARFDAALARHIVCARHDLAGDASFNEFHLILCRNVLIYFGAALQAHVHRLLHGSLAHGGVLCLGATESLFGTPCADAYTAIDDRLRLYRKHHVSEVAP